MKVADQKTKLAFLFLQSRIRLDVYWVEGWEHIWSKRSEEVLIFKEGSDEVQLLRLFINDRSQHITLHYPKSTGTWFVG